jgi:hypothetical protein
LAKLDGASPQFNGCIGPEHLRRDAHVHRKTRIAPRRRWAGLLSSHGSQSKGRPYRIVTFRPALTQRHCTSRVKGIRPI